MDISRLSASLEGITVKSSVLATQTAPREKHTKTRSMSESYHQRIQKKWTKRWGTKQEPAAFLVYGNVLVAHPEIVAALEQHAVKLGK